MLPPSTDAPHRTQKHERLARGTGIARAEGAADHQGSPRLGRAESEAPADLARAGVHTGGVRFGLPRFRDARADPSVEDPTYWLIDQFKSQLPVDPLPGFRRAAGQDPTDITQTFQRAPYVGPGDRRKSAPGWFVVAGCFACAAAVAWFGQH